MTEDHAPAKKSADVSPGRCANRFTSLAGTISWGLLGFAARAMIRSRRTGRTMPTGQSSWSNPVSEPRGSEPSALFSARHSLLSKGNDINARLAMFAIAVCLASPPIAAQQWSWDPLKDVENALPEGVPNEGRIIQARQQVREMSQGALAALVEIVPGAVPKSTAPGSA